ncbi:glycine cleavage system protein H [Gloeomargarita lithophora Alchichica-D10]|uniref:Glycine cleavage system H protein n=1 Tax=Gloeomargarita lithophora Alchichica-D10 TaxID=1188229 RepID=A0A1J0AGS1_9CYAN|nr:glycine cleavage system protein GcvH [Gloeomargarita lithophora]APB35140.1 glycine cleavage system protein H [Gloeomargarita lithophora Alchichica-D10]
MTLTYPAELHYTASHEYVALTDGLAVVGITSFAIEELGDITYLELPPVGRTVTCGERFGTIESVKAVSDLYAPVSGVVRAVHGELVDAPERLAEDPYGIGWLLKIQLTQPEETQALLTAADYQAQLGG